MARKKELTDAEKVSKIEDIVLGTDEHRTRSKREAWEAVKGVLGLADVPTARIDAGTTEELLAAGVIEDNADQTAEGAEEAVAGEAVAGVATVETSAEDQTAEGASRAW